MKRHSFMILIFACLFTGSTGYWPMRDGVDNEIVAEQSEKNTEEMFDKKLAGENPPEEPPRDGDIRTDFAAYPYHIYAYTYSASLLIPPERLI